MIDRQLRRVVAPPLDTAGRRLRRLGVRPGWVTATGWVAGVGACVAAGSGRWWLALGLWLANRVLDGLDGPVARAGTPSERGGFLDVVADFSVYGGFVVGVAVALPAARIACIALLLAYYTSGSAFLALSSLLERRGTDDGDERSLHFVGGLAEGAETILVYVAFCLFPNHATVIAWVFTAAVAVTAGQRVWIGVRLLSRPARSAVVAAERDASQWYPDLASLPVRGQLRRSVHSGLGNTGQVQGPDEDPARVPVGQRKGETSATVIDHTQARPVRAGGEVRQVPVVGVGEVASVQRDHESPVTGQVSRGQREGTGEQ